MRLFVYGTLLSGEANHHVLAGARLLGPATTVRAFTLVDLGAFPGMRAGGISAVVGELYEVAADLTARLDVFEGHPKLLRRTEIWLADGGRAQAYLLPVPPPVTAPVIAGGDWRRRRKGNA